MKEFEEMMLSREKQADYDYTVGHEIAFLAIQWFLSRRMIKSGWCIAHTSEILGMDDTDVMAAFSLGTETEVLGVSILAETLFDILISHYGDDMTLERIAEIVEDESGLIREMILMADDDLYPL